MRNLLRFFIDSLFLYFMIMMLSMGLLVALLMLVMGEFLFALQMFFAAMLPLYRQIGHLLARLGFIIGVGSNRQSVLCTALAALSDRKKSYGHYTLGEDQARIELRYSIATPLEPDSISLAIPHNSPLRFRISQEKGSGALFSFLRYVRDLEIGDETFDLHLILETSQSDQVRTFLRQEENKELVLQIFESGASEVYCGSGELKIVYKNAPEEKINARLRVGISLLRQMKAVLLGQDKGSAADRVFLSFYRRAIVYASYLLCIGFISLSNELPFQKILSPIWFLFISLCVAVLVFIFLLRIFAFFARRTPHATTDLKLMVGFVAGASFFGAQCLTYTYNTAADTGDLSAEQVQVISLDAGSLMSPAVLVQGQDGRAFTLSIEREFKESLSKGDRIELRIQPGALGLEWLRSIEKNSSGEEQKG